MRPKVLVNGVEVKNPSWSMESDITPYYSLSPKLDPGWQYTDPAGHDHLWETEDTISNAVWIVDREYCSDCEDTHDYGHWECHFCGDILKPTYLPTPPGGWEYQSIGPQKYNLSYETSNRPGDDNIVEIDDKKFQMFVTQIKFKGSGWMVDAALLPLDS